MKTDQDPRIAVRIAPAAEVGAAEVGAAALIEGAGPTAGSVAHYSLPATAHALGCACCLPRGPAAVALGRLFLARARGEAPLFDTVVAVTRTPAGEAAVRAALADDLVTRARFRLVA
jgi:hypothetical protein